MMLGVGGAAADEWLDMVRVLSVPWAASAGLWGGVGTGSCHELHHSEVDCRGQRLERLSGTSGRDA